MSKFDETLDQYKSEMDKLKLDYDAALLQAVTKGLGPSIYLADASKVSCSDSEELNRVKKNFLQNKLGFNDEAKADAAIKTICEKMGSSNRNKYRAIFYYLLVKELGQEKFYSQEG